MITDISFEALTYMVRFEQRPAAASSMKRDGAAVMNEEWGVNYTNDGRAHVSIPGTTLLALERHGLARSKPAPWSINGKRAFPTRAGRALVRGQALQ